MGNDWSSSSHSNQYLESQVERLNSELAMADTRISALEVERRELKKAFAQLIQRMTQAGVLDDSDGAWIADYLQPPGGKSEPVATAAARAAHKVVGKVRCKCGATVDDVEGVTDERCGWCGEVLRTRR